MFWEKQFPLSVDGEPWTEYCLFFLLNGKSLLPPEDFYELSKGRNGAEDKKTIHSIDAGLENHVFFAIQVSRTEVAN